jgi:hypothetical protein
MIYLTTISVFRTVLTRMLGRLVYGEMESIWKEAGLRVEILVLYLSQLWCRNPVTQTSSFIAGPTE